MSFIPLRDCDVISTTYLTKPSYIFSMSVDGANGGHSDPIYVFSGSEQGIVYQDLNGLPITGTTNLTGTVEVVSSPGDLEKRSIFRLREIYASRAFEKPQNFNSSSIWGADLDPTRDFAYINIPTLVYGRNIERETFNLTIGLNIGDFTYYDDGYGGLYTASLLVGAVFYEHGIVYLDGSHFSPGDFLMATASFSGSHPIPMNMYICSVPPGELNFSRNPSYTLENTSSNKNEITTKNPKTFITSIGLYDEEYKLVGIAKVSTPILNQEENGVTFRLKLNF